MAKKLTNVNIFKFRVVIDTEQDVFRDIEIETDSVFESLHQSILDAFDFEAGEMASFYMSNEKWERGLEVPLLEMGSREEGGTSLSMKNTKLAELLSQPGQKVLYVYDFLRMWCFYLELLEVTKDKPSTIYPRVAMIFGEAPSQDSKEMDLMGEEFDQEEFDALNGRHEDEEEDEDGADFDADNELSDGDEFGGSYKDSDDY